MRRNITIAVVTAATTIAALTSCSDNTAAPETTTVATPSPYDTYLELTNELGGETISREDAAVRAQLLCSGAAKDMLGGGTNTPGGDDNEGGVPLSEYPTDLALIRAYCPDVEAEYP